MIPLILFIVLAVVVLVLTEVHERQKKAKGQEQPAKRASSSASDGECCGMHLVCEKETLLQPDATPEYYDDEELDAFAGMEPESYTPAQQEAFRQVFQTLQEKDVPGWCRSLQLRQITLPPDIREEALLIVREQRSHRENQ